MTTIDPRHLLVVEDDEDIRTLIAKYLVDHGFTVTLAGSGGEMDKILASEKVDLVVLDVNLPGEDGFSICLRLRNVNRLPVVMVTSRGEDMDRILGIELGADIVIHSTSKFINGTGSAIGGAIVDMGVFDWSSSKFPHFAPFVNKYRSFAFTARARKLIHKDFGACAAPMNSFLFTEGIETLGLRMERHCFNALELARFLCVHNKVAWVNYPGLEENAGHATAKRIYNNKFGGILTFGLADRDTAFRFINGLQLAKNLANIGDAKTLVIHPASTICADFGAEEKELMGVREEMVRVSVGIEAIEDIIEDFRQALENI